MMNNFEMRWFATRDGTRILQYRKYINTTVYAGMPTPEQVTRFAKFEWTPWQAIPTEYEHPYGTVTPITSEMVSTLRDRTDCTLMDCKKALQNADGDLNLAEQFLRNRLI